MSYQLQVGARWFLRHTGLQISWQDLATGRGREGLPPQVRGMDARLHDWSHLVRHHYRWVDEVDVTAGWMDQDARHIFLAEARALQKDLRRTLGSGWSVEVSLEPGLADVRLMGEYGCHWPLWTAGGGTGPEHWPMLSTSMVERLETWALSADPDYWPGPPPDVTEQLRRDLQIELGDHFRVQTHEWTVP